MKKTLALILLLTLALVAGAQETKSSSLSYQYQQVTVKAKVLDAQSLLPIPYVSVYLTPQGDTTITHFALSDENGKVVLEKVPSGKYRLNAELLGYKTFVRDYEIYQVPGWDLDLGTIGLEESDESIDASTITAAGNPIIIRNDTLIYNASSFRVGENAMLEDLLKKMPGIEVSEDGTATVNGEKVDRITVGGKTFFFGDPSMAIKNLPAKIVEKIKVTREESKSARMHGISTGMEKEMVMDVELKEAYQEGWFGDARLGAGATLTGREDHPLTEKTKFLYDASAMASIYGKKDQAVFIGNAYNVQDAGKEVSPSGLSGLPEDDYTELKGLTAAIRGGANYNTSRIRDFETTVSANYRHAVKDDRQRSSRTSFVPGGNDFLTEGGADAVGMEDQLVVDAELSKEEGRLLVDFSPRFYFRRSSVDAFQFSDTYAAGTGAALNASSASWASLGKQFLASGSLGLTGTNLGETGRRIGFSLDYSAGASDGNKLEQSLQTLDYAILGKRLDLEGILFYYEPMGERWGVETGLGSSYNANLSDRRASDADGGVNMHFTKRMDRIFRQEAAYVNLQYRQESSSVKFGVNASAYNDRTRVSSPGVEAISGEGDWRFRWSPVAMYSYSTDEHQFTFQYSGVTDPASSRLMIPVPDLSHPAQVTTGNTHLRSSVENSLMAYYNMVNYSTYSFLTLYATANIERNGTVYASWFDPAGIRYAVPVNARKPGTSAIAMALFNQPFGKEKNFTLSLAGQVNLDNRYSYQAQSLQQGLDLVHFDYDAFMDEFWGNADGDRFYSGQSGFSESLTRSLTWGIGLNLKYNKDFFTGTLIANAMNGRASCSLNPSADMNVWDFSWGGDFLFQMGKGWEFKTDARHVFYHGYADGFGQAEVRWNLSLAKTFKPVTLSLKFNDILNQQRSLTRVVSSEYVEDAYRNVMGRTLLFSVSFNFGKLNADRTSAVSQSIEKLGY